MGWIVDNWKEISLAALAVWRVADMVAKLTPTNKDNEVIDAIGRILKLKKG